jgi:hypothetical protein
MKKSVSAVFAFAAAAFVASSFALPSDAMARSRPAPSPVFDGLWSVSIVTMYGNCDRGYRYPLRIEGGLVGKADTDPNYDVAGAVARSGAIGVTVAGGGQTASGTGRLSRNYGRGVWRTASGECSGVWTAERRG